MWGCETKRGALKASRIRILVVDDFEPWRRFISSALSNQSKLEVIANASDGLVAVQKAEELQPDLVLLDIGLPSLNGIEAARQIRKLSPKSRILFVSEHCSVDIAKEAIRAGGNGYLVKSGAGKELLPAVTAILQGEQFASPSLGNSVFSDTADEQELNPASKVVAVNLVSNGNENCHRHEVVFYPNDASLVVGFSRFAESELQSGTPVIVIATKSHLADILRRLRADGVDIEAAIRQGRYIPLDPVEMLSGFMIDDMPDPDSLMSTAKDLIGDAAKAAQGEHPRVALCGEGVSILLAQGKAEATIRLEHLWDLIAKSYPVNVLCGYLSTAFAHDDNGQILERIREEHSADHVA
jgi:DNA-binding NarL/FixJ family response regulator